MGGFSALPYDPIEHQVVPMRKFSKCVAEQVEFVAPARQPDNNLQQSSHMSGVLRNQLWRFAQIGVDLNGEESRAVILRFNGVRSMPLRGESAGVIAIAAMG